MRNILLSLYLTSMLGLFSWAHSMETPQKYTVKSDYAWLTSGAKDTCFAAVCVAGSQALAPLAWESFRSTTLGQTIAPTITALYTNFEKDARIVLPAALGLAIGYRAYKAQQNLTIPSNKLSFISSWYNQLFSVAQKVVPCSRAFNPEAPIGFNNPHNNCFMNAILQVFSTITPVADYLTTTTDRYKPNALTGYYKTFLSNLEQAKKTRSWVFDTKAFCRQARTLSDLEAETQEDAQEFYSNLLDRLTESDLIDDQAIPMHGFPYNHLKNSSLGSLFTIILRSTISSVEGIKVTGSPEKILSLQVPEDKDPISLYSLLDTFFAPTDLEENTQTQEKQKKQFSLVNTPLFLTFQLKRFKFDQTYRTSSKIATRVTLPLDLKLDNYFIDPINTNPVDATYKLFAIAMHIGSSPRGGHYYAYVCKNSVWYCCSDSTITEFNDIQKLTETGYVNSDAQPYLLFYKRETPEHKHQNNAIATETQLLDALNMHTITQEDLTQYLATKKIAIHDLLKGLQQGFLSIEAVASYIKEPSPIQAPQQLPPTTVKQTYIAMIKTLLTKVVKYIALKV